MAQITTQQEGVKTTQGMETQMILKVGNECSRLVEMVEGSLHLKSVIYIFVFMKFFVHDQD